MTVEKARKIIGKEADNYSDDDILEIINTFTIISDMAIDSFLEKRRAGKLPKKPKGI